jgi:hypothetical protein
MCGDTLHVIDLKYGKGVRVDAEENTQGILYALGALNDYGSFNAFKQVVITIVQPRLDHVSEWTISIDELNAWGERLKQAAELANLPDAPRTAGEKQCQWCLAKAKCGELKKIAESVMLSNFDDFTPPNPDTLTDEQLRLALESKKLIVSWLDAVEELVTSQLMSGKLFAGFKLVEGRSTRAWVDDEQAAIMLSELLGNEAFEHKLLSVAKAEKVLGKSKKELIESLSVKPRGSPTLAPDSDKRPSCIINADMFDTM